MGEQIAVQASEEVARQAALAASRARRPIEDALAEWPDRTIAGRPVDTLPDEELLAVADTRLPPAQDAALSDLLAASREGTILPHERRRLDDVMHLCERGSLRRAQALREAVQRGLREPLGL